MNRLRMTVAVLMGLAVPSLSVSIAKRTGPGPFIRSGPGPFTIKVEIEGVTEGVFQSVEGLSSLSDVVHSDTGGMSIEEPGALKGTRLVLKRPYDPAFNGLWHWRQSVIDGNPQRRDGHIFLFDGRGDAVAHWVFHQGWPCRWEVPSVKASSDEVAIKEVEIVHQGLSLQE